MIRCAAGLAARAEGPLAWLDTRLWHGCKAAPRSILAHAGRLPVENSPTPYAAPVRGYVVRKSNRTESLSYGLYSTTRYAVGWRKVDHGVCTFSKVCHNSTSDIPSATTAQS